MSHKRKAIAFYTDEEKRVRPITVSRGRTICFVPALTALSTLTFKHEPKSSRESEPTITVVSKKKKETKMYGTFYVITAILKIGKTKIKVKQQSRDPNEIHDEWKLTRTQMKKLLTETKMENWLFKSNYHFDGMFDGTVDDIEPFRPLNPKLLEWILDTLKWERRFEYNAKTKEFEIYSLSNSFTLKYCDGKKKKTLFQGRENKIFNLLLDSKFTPLPPKAIRIGSNNTIEQLVWKTNEEEKHYILRIVSAKSFEVFDEKNNPVDPSSIPHKRRVLFEQMAKKLMQPATKYRTKVAEFCELFGLPPLEQNKAGWWYLENYSWTNKNINEIFGR
ncbi:MAG: hypothetical protein B6U95_00045 [Thermofilum sp. ex4484_82]|nr:MAG: hypothetical protein B6U95_00045 [Thermofilum sp. ex4484_82]OYT40120.1 MAG: hypothetical protein B6U96_00045 [Archaeoglobales archaeon ex4484_92]